MLHLYRLLPRGAEPDLERRWTEWYALEALLQRGDVEAVHLWTWNWLDKPKPYRNRPFRQGEATHRLDRIRDRLEEALASWQKGVFPAKPGNHCYTCSFADICRKEEA